MKHLNTLLILLLLFPISLFSQNHYKYSYKEGYKFLGKAQKKIDKKDFDNATKLVNKAKNSNFGFCGNAWAEAESKIKMIEVQILNNQKKIDESLAILESIGGCSLGADCLKRDSLKIETLFLKFGKEKVKNAFKKIENVNTKPENNNDDEYEVNYSVFVTDLNYNFNFIQRNFILIDENGKEIIPKKTDNKFFNIVQNQPFYELLQ